MVKLVMMKYHVFNAVGQWRMICMRVAD